MSWLRAIIKDLRNMFWCNFVLILYSQSAFFSHVGIDFPGLNQY